MSNLKVIIKKVVGRKVARILKKGIIISKGVGFHLMDILIIPFTIFFAFLFKIMRIRQFSCFPISKKILFTIGVYPIRDHYFEPMFNPKHLHKSLRENRNLPGIDLNIIGQLETLRKFSYADELLKIPTVKKDDALEFCHNFGPFPPADAEYFYNMIRYFKPNKIVEVGSGHSTLMALNALKVNKIENKEYNCEHVCIEPFEIEWLESLNIKVVRDLVEKTDISLFKSLNANDILFIDSSHMIRPQGDVLFEYLEILPILKPGVLIHIHDIFTPEDYPDVWIKNAVFWNEQYLLEAFLSCNKEFKILGGTNYLKRNHYSEFSSKCPITKMLTEKGEIVGAGSFWIVKN